MAKKQLSLEALRPFCEQTAADMGLEFCEVLIEKEPQGRYLRFYVDKEGGLSLDDCERFHRAVQPRAEAIDYDFMEVCSPGLDRPVRTERDIRRALGQRVSVRLYRPEDGSKQFESLTAAGQYHFPVILAGYPSAFWEKAKTGMDQACGEMGVAIEVTGTENAADIEGLVMRLSEEIEKTPPAIALAYDDPAAISSVLAVCRQKEIPVVMLDAPAGSSDEAVACTISVDNGASGAAAAENLFLYLQSTMTRNDKTVRVGIVCPDASATIRLRTLGFINRLIRRVHDSGRTVAIEGDPYFTESADGADSGACALIIEAFVSESADKESCRAAADGILAKEDLVGVFAASQTAAEGLLEADSGQNRLGTDPPSGDIVGIGFDSGSAVLEAVKDGRLLGAVTRSPVQTGYYAVCALTAAANKSELEDVAVDYYWYDASTVSQEMIAQNLYE